MSSPQVHPAIMLMVCYSNSMKILQVVLLICLSVGILSLPEMASAQLVPCSGGPSDPCDTCHVIALVNEVISWLIGILFLVFAILMSVAGIQLVTSGGNTSALEAAKSKFKNALIGIIITMAAWLMVDTLLKVILNNGEIEWQQEGGGVIPRPWQEIECFTAAVPTPEGTLDSWAASTTISGPQPYTASTTLTGPGNPGIVDFADQMAAAGCVYNQALRNGCRGNPGYTDCSDLVANARAANGWPPRGVTTAQMHQPQNSVPIALAGQLQPGDAVVYRRPDNTGHVVICKNVGCTEVIHARGRGRGIQSTPSAYHLQQPGARVLRRD